jgi:hypothetical protein
MYISAMHWVRAALVSQPEMIQHLLPAATERFGDAQAVLAGGSATGSVYIGGYCVEMVLKHAALRAEGLPPFALVRDALAPARARLRAWLGGVEHDGYHSLEFWALLLRETFRHRHGSVPERVGAVVRAACRLHEGWQVALRYRSEMISETDARTFLRDAGRFPARDHDLWR